jgi:hypothetical protein
LTPVRRGWSTPSVVKVMAAPLLLVTAVACRSEAPEPPNPVEGMVVAIEGDDLTLATSEGDRYTFEIADPSVPVSHLHEHRLQRLPVRITWRREGERLLATRIADAPVGS